MTLGHEAQRPDPAVGDGLSELMERPGSDEGVGAYACSNRPRGRATKVGTSREQYRAIASCYDRRLQVRLGERTRRMAFEEFDLRPGDTVVDVGCGRSQPSAHRELDRSFRQDDRRRTQFRDDASR